MPGYESGPALLLVAPSLCAIALVGKVRIELTLPGPKPGALPIRYIPMVGVFTGPGPMSRSLGLLVSFVVVRLQ